MSHLVPPHGGGELQPLLLQGEELAAARNKAEGLPRIPMTSRETSDLIMLGIGAFTPLEGFMGSADWRGVCEGYRTAAGLFWPIPITLSTGEAEAAGLREGQEAALVDGESGELMGSITITEKYAIDRELECRSVFRTTDTDHPGVQKIMAQGEVNVAGPVKVFSEGAYPRQFGDLYLRPAESRRLFSEKGWSTVAALQLRNPMHRSHEYLAKIAIEICDGVFIHQLIGRLKPGDIPADVRTKAISRLVELYFVPDTVIMGGYPMEMRYAGPREALLHALFRQNYGCSHLIIGRDHAGVGEYYGPFDAQNIFHDIPAGSLECQPLPVDWTFYCRKCDQMASMRTCPHGKEDRVLLSGTMLRKMLSEGKEVSPMFSRPEVVEILAAYYAGLDEKVEIEVHRYATGEGEGVTGRPHSGAGGTPGSSEPD